MKTRIWIALIALYIVWGSTYLAIRFAVETIPPFLMAGTRFLISGLILYVWRRLAGDPTPTLRQWRSAAIMGLLLLLGGNGVVSWAEQHVPSGIAALMVASIPLWMVVIDTVRPGGSKPDRRIILGLLIGFGGLALLVAATQGLTPADRLDTVGILALVLAAFLWSLGSVYSRDAEMPKSSLMGTGIEMLAGAAGLFIAGTLSGEWQALDLAAIRPASLLGLAYLVTFGSLIGFVAYAWLLRNAPLSLVSTYAYVNPVIAIFLGAWLGSEPINAQIIVAALVIIGSVVMINLSKRSRIQPDEEAALNAAD
jgi:drug/metabolite transporter (DMT)-like permease